MARIAVTGGSGKAGRAVVRDLSEHGHEVLNVDLVPSAESYAPDGPIPFLQADKETFLEYDIAKLIHDWIAQQGLVN